MSHSVGFTFYPRLTATTDDRDWLPVNCALPCILPNLLERRHPIPSSIHACQSKQGLVRGPPVRREKTSRGGPNVPLCRHAVADRAWIEAVAP
jgi:hypothetical protein